jgi:ABC-2 type transport system permease protein
MKELIAIFSPQWWTFKNRLFRSDWTAYVKSAFILLLGAGFWAVALHYLAIMLTRLQGMESNVGSIVALKGLSVLLMLVFFLLIFSSLLASISGFYLSRDLPVILSSPVSWGSIYLSKWLETVIKSSWMIIFAVFPVFIAFGVFYKVAISYYLVLLPLLVMYSMIPAGIGILISLFLMAVLPAKRAKNIFFILGLLMLVILFLLFRFLRPERFANPEWFANMAIFLSEMKMPVSVFLPSMWVTETLTPFFNAADGVPLLFVLLLFFTACVSVIFGNWLFNAFYYNGLVKAQQTQKPLFTASEERISLFSLKNAYSCLLRTASFFFRGSRLAVIEKDIITFFRSVGQWSQMLLLFAIIVIYLFSIKALPVEWGTYLSLKLRYIISFLNIGLVGFVITAVASRLVLPSIDSEGPAFWIIRVSPVSMLRFIRAKFFLAFIPLFILAQVLIVTSNLFLGVKPWFMVLSISTCSVLVFSITGLAVGTGAYIARFSQVGSGREQSGFSSTAYMLMSFAVIMITILLEIVPATTIFIKDLSEAALTSRGWTIVGLLFLAVLVFNAFVYFVAMKTGEKRLASLE